MSKQNDKFTHRDGISLREYIEARLDAIEKATNLAKEQMNYRLEGMNEFREQLNRQAATFVTNKELNAKLDGLEKSRRDNLSLLISLVALGIGILGFVVKFN